MHIDTRAALLRQLIDHDGLLTTTTLRSAHIGRDRTRRLVAAGDLLTLALGVYTVPALAAALSPWSWFALRSAAFLTAAPSDAVAAGWSTVALQDLPHLGDPPPLPSVIRRASPPRGSERTPYGHTRFASIDPDWVVPVRGFSTLHPAVAVVDIARRCGTLDTLVVADAVARRLGGTAQMHAAAQAMRHWPAARRSYWAITRADADCDSPLETLGRHAVIRAGLPTPRSNVWIGLGEPRYRVDHYWAEQRVALEGDGIGKYRFGSGGRSAGHRERRDDRGNRAGSGGRERRWGHGDRGGRGDGYDALLAEKDREIELSSWGIATGRYTWGRALSEPGTVANHCAQLLEYGGGRPHPGLRVWSATEGYRLLGMTPPKDQLRPGPGWQQDVASAVRAIAVHPMFAG